MQASGHARLRNKAGVTVPWLVVGWRTLESLQVVAFSDVNQLPQLPFFSSSIEPKDPSPEYTRLALTADTSSMMTVRLGKEANSGQHCCDVPQVERNGPLCKSARLGQAVAPRCQCSHAQYRVRAAWIR